MPIGWRPPTRQGRPWNSFAPTRQRKYAPGRSAAVWETSATTIHNYLSNSDRPDSLVAEHNLIGVLEGSPIDYPNEQPRPKGAIMSDSNPSGLSDNAAAGIAYITLIPAIVFLIIAPFKNSSYVRFHAWQSIFFFIAWAVIDILVGVVQNLVPSTVFLTLTVLQLVGLAIFIVWIIVFVQAFNGKRIKLPVIGDLAEKQANR
jgi:uncharacterized membrane protein